MRNDEDAEGERRHSEEIHRCDGLPIIYQASLSTARSPLFAFRLEAEILAEEGHCVILESISNGAGVRARVNLKAVRDAIVVQDVMQFCRVEA